LLALFVGAFLYGPAASAMPAGEWVLSCLFVGLLTALPLLGLTHAVIRPTPRRVSWLSFLLLGYLIFGIVLAFSARGLVAGVLITLTTLSTFVYCIRWLRPYKKAVRARQKSGAGQR
jgi:uncharacterized membrane protein